ncbi:hypothetical protein [Streptomyces sp. 7N604]|uniref:hypothetical protein n=1 Tax=Streptomyces sp. 7N604 TaxID=3457415 RepID=UPI003FD204E7
MRLTEEQKNPAALADWPEHIQRSVRSEAEVWRYGHVASALDSFVSTVEWARGMNQQQRRYHHSGAWYANQNMKAAAIAYVQAERGDDPECDIHLCPPGRTCHPDV